MDSKFVLNGFDSPIIEAGIDNLSLYDKGSLKSDMNPVIAATTKVEFPLPLNPKNLFLPLMDKESAQPPSISFMEESAPISLEPQDLLEANFSCMESPIKDLPLSTPSKKSSPSKIGLEISPLVMWIMIFNPLLVIMKTFPK